MRDRIRLKTLETAEACYEHWGVNSFGASCTTEKTAIPTGLTVKLCNGFQLVGKECCEKATVKECVEKWNGRRKRDEKRRSPEGFSIIR